MDSLTQITLGAAVGEAVAGKKIGNKAAIWGAVAGFFPDLDVAANWFMGTVDAIAFHRGLTHSIFFALIVAPAFGAGLRRLYRNESASLRDWTLLVFLGLFTHALLDCFTTWGTQLFWPFSDYRVAFKSIFVIDPLYTLPLLICLVWLLFLPRHAVKRRRLNQLGLGLSTLYLLITLFVKMQANQVFLASFERKEMEVLRFESKPAPFNIILWAATAETPDGYFIGYYSFLDEDENIDFQFYPKNHDKLAPFRDARDVRKLLQITDDWFTVESADKGIIVNDLRFGQSAGWETGEGQFVFSYQIYRSEGEVIVDEVEKDLSEARGMLGPLWNRIWGK